VGTRGGVRGGGGLVVLLYNLSTSRGGPSPVFALFRRVADSQASTVKIRGGELTQ
jgi:hypothetical protein